MPKTIILELRPVPVRALLRNSATPSPRLRALLRNGEGKPMTRRERLLRNSETVPRGTSVDPKTMRENLVHMKELFLDSKDRELLERFDTMIDWCENAEAEG